MRYLVTGGAGFIGSHLVDALVSGGHAVCVLDNFNSGSRENLSHAVCEGDVDIFEGDVRDEDVVMEACDGVDGVFHLAAMVSVPESISNPRKDFETNIHGTFNVFEAARQKKVNRLVFASSCAVYGDQEMLPIKEPASLKPASPYALDKWYGEQLAAMYATLYGMHTTALRFFNVYGPRQAVGSQYSGVISIFLRKLLSSESPVIYGDGEQTREFVYVKDVIQANLLAMKSNISGFSVYNVGSGSQVSINSLLLACQRISKTDINPRYDRAREGEIRHSAADLSHISSDLHYEAQWGLEEGLKTLCNFQQMNGGIA